MKDIDFKGKSAPRVFGKGVMIVIVVIFSSLSFVLGFFVGKIGRTGPPEQTVTAPLSQKAPEPLPAESQKQETPVQGSVQPAEQQSVQQPEPQRQAPAEDKRPPAVVKETPKTAANNFSPEKPKQTAKAPQMEIQQGARKETANAEKTAGEEIRQKSKESYTVQLGALKNADVAKKLRSKFEKKGYKTFLTVSKGKKREKIYKIRVGEFKDRKDAEILALKLKKNEGLSTFVTVKE